MGEHYLVYGAGTMGLLMAQLAPRAGAPSVTIVDINGRRLRTATELGIQHVLTNADDAGRENWDVVIDRTGSIRATPTCFKCSATASAARCRSGRTTRSRAR